PFQPARYGSNRWAPVLIAWSNEGSYQSLAGYIAGQATSMPEYTSGNQLVYVSGSVVLDEQDLSAANIPNRDEARAIILHELGHLVGLDHTADQTQIMFSENKENVTDYGPGDLRGLALVGKQPCHPDV